MNTGKILRLFFGLIFLVAVQQSVLAAPVLSVSVRATGTGNTFYYYITITNSGSGGFATDKATGILVTAQVPAGASFVSANLGGTLSGTTVTWNINNLAGSSGGSTGRVTPTMVVTTNAAAGTSITLVASTTNVNCAEDATVKHPAADVTKTVTAASAVVEIDANGNDATAAANLVTNGDGSKSTDVNFPYKTWTAAMALVKTNNKKFQTVKFRPGTYTDGVNDIQSTSSAVNLSASGKAIAGLVIDGQGALLDGSGSTSNFFFLGNDPLITDVVIKNIVFSTFNDVGSGNYNVAYFGDVDGLVIDNCTFYSSQTRQPISIEFTNSHAMAVTISNCVFSGNSRNIETSSSGAMEITGSSTQTSTNPFTVNIDNTFFSCNRRNSDGGALKIYGSSEDGRASTFNLSGCTFQGNLSSTLGSGGAGIYISSSSSSGTMSNLNIYNTDFLENLLTGSTAAGGEAIYCGRQIVNIYGGLFSHNGYNGAAGSKGGCVGAVGGTALSVVGITGTYNVASTNGGVYLNGGTAVLLDNCYFSNNSGGVASTNNVSFTNTTILGGTVPASVTTISTCNQYSNYLGAITGTVYDDKNGLSDQTVNGTGVGPGGNGAGTSVAFNGNLYASLVDSATNKVVAYVSVASNGTFTFPAGTIRTNLGTAGNSSPSYSVVLSTSTPTVGNTITASLPADWASTGENIGSTAGNDGNINTILAGYNIVAFGTSISNLNLGINKKPAANSTSSSSSNPGGTGTVTVPDLNGSDFEDGNFVAGSGTTTIKIQSLPSNGLLYYNNVLVNAGDVIANYNPALLKVDPDDGITTLFFTFSSVDAAGAVSNPATVTMAFATLPVQLISFRVEKQPGCKSRLVWKAASGSSSKQFIIEKSEDGIDFKAIGQVSALLNAATDTQYELFDRSLSSVNFYRLKMLDADGSSGYSAILKLTSNCSNGIIATIMPNPVTGNRAMVNILSDESVAMQFTWMDFSGKVLSQQFRQLQPGSNMIMQDLNGFCKGAYFLKISRKQGGGDILIKVFRD